MARNCGSCMQRQLNAERRAAATEQMRSGSSSERRVSQEALVAGAQSRYLVVPNQLASTGKRFSTLAAAQDYARSVGGIIRHL